MQAPRPSKPSKRLIKLSTDHYRLRTLTVDDASDRWAVWFSEPYVITMLNARPVDWNKATVIKYINQFDQRSDHLLGIFEKENETLIGIWTLKINYQTNQCLVSTVIGEAEYRRKGALSETRAALYDYLFDDLGLEMMLASALSRNTIIINTMLKHGWKLDKTMKNHTKSNSDGTMLDLCLFSFTRESWLAWKRSLPAS
jgi:RimJ/RimL family protein N-acetyltransferase